jgi:hypothetical protein
MSHNIGTEPPKLVLEQPFEAASLGIEPPHFGQSRLIWYRAAAFGTEPPHLV